jgi:hypothetical protein
VPSRLEAVSPFDLDSQLDPLHQVGWDVALTALPDHDFQFGLKVVRRVATRARLKVTHDLHSPNLGEFAIEEVVEPGNHGGTVADEAFVEFAKGVGRVMRRPERETRRRKMFRWWLN